MGSTVALVMKTAGTSHDGRLRLADRPCARRLGGRGSTGCAGSTGERVASATFWAAHHALEVTRVGPNRTPIFASRVGAHASRDATGLRSNFVRLVAHGPSDDLEQARVHPRISLAKMFISNGRDTVR